MSDRENFQIVTEELARAEFWRGCLNFSLLANDHSNNRSRKEKKSNLNLFYGLSVYENNS